MPCAAFPGDDVVVTALNANLAGRARVSLPGDRTDDAVMGQIDDILVAGWPAGVMWVTPGALIRSLPTQRVRLTLRSADDARLIAEYALEHTGLESSRADLP